MKKKGYQIKDLPKNPKKLMEELINDPEALEGAPELSIAHRMTVDQYQELTPYSERLEETIRRLTFQ